MNKVHQYFPEFVDGEPIRADFSTQEELMAMDWIVNWSRKPGFVEFYMDKISPDLTWHKSEYALYAKIAGTGHDWLIAFIKNSDGITVPPPRQGENKRLF